MNDLGLMVLRAALQGTILALAAVPLYLAAARRGPRAGALVASLYLTLSGILVLLALCPQPSWWSWEPALETDASSTLLAPGPVPTPVIPDSPSAHDGMLSDRTGGLMSSLASLRSAWHQLGTLTTAAPEPGLSWINIVAFCFLMGSGLSLLRFVLGLSDVYALRRQSRPITDADLNALAEELQGQLGCQRPVSLAESRDLGSPATIGWRSPLVLLPEDWRHWSDAERRAVLAHELAHVCCSDYLRGLLARLSIALQFYQPLVYWLASRLHLQQELAADALAARISGGRGPYLRALSEMALRQDGRLRDWPALAFLSLPGTLMRRIHMLRTQDGSPETRLPRTLHVALTAVLVLVAGAVSTLRTPAQKPADRSPALPTSQDISTPQIYEPPAFDLSYLGPDFPGVIAFRPAAVLGRPEAKKILPVLNRAFVQGFELFFQIRACVDLRLEDVEQVICPAVIRTDKHAEPDRRSQLITTINLVRTVHDYDWRRLLKALMPDLEEVNYAGKVYYRTPEKAKLSPVMAMLGKGICFYIPDGRTLVMLTEPSLRLVLDGKASRPTWIEDWKQVEHGLAAVAFDSRDKSWLDGRVDPPVDEVEAAALPICKAARSFVIGLDADRGLSYRLVLRGENTEAASQIASAAEKVLAACGRALQEQRAQIPPLAGTVEILCLDILTKALQQTHIKPEGTAVVVRATIKEDLGQFLRAVLDQLPPEVLK